MFFGSVVELCQNDIPSSDADYDPELSEVDEDLETMVFDDGDEGLNGEVLDGDDNREGTLTAKKVWTSCPE
ncbi:MAG: hypothetical protein Q9213_002816 [Squamulea squamosa]